MSIPNICRYISTLTISIFFALSSAEVYAQTDTTAADTTVEQKVKKKDVAGNQLCVSVDIFHPILNQILTDRYSYEGALDYYLKNEYYAVAEGGAGGCTVNYTDLKYTTTNSFLRLGFNKSVLTRDKPLDWDMMFIGMRVGFTSLNRGPANFLVVDSLWGNSDSSTSSKRFGVFWVELTTGVRVEIA